MKPLLLAFFAALLFSCNNSTEQKHDDHGQQQVKEHDHAADEAMVKGVQLDNGKKWQANAETTEGIHQMHTQVGRAIEGSMPVAVLSDSLLASFNTILKKCTMKGAAHDELHDYLMPLKSKMDALPKDSSTARLQELKSYLESYHQYFQ